jgi:pectinesterase
MKKISLTLILLISALFIIPVRTAAQDLFDMTVAGDGTANFTTIQQAIDACKSFPDKRIIIHVKNGIYHEKLVVPAWNNKLSIIGENAEKTIITFGDNFGSIKRGRNSTFFTYTLLIDADDFYAENLTIENSSGPVGQAVALHVSGDRCSFYNCRILGNQDTLYTDGLNTRQYYAGCYIEGTTDFIFGAATVLFDDCTICSKANSYITAASTPDGKKFGYVFLNCRIIAVEGVNKVYLGRPWRDFANVVFIRCSLGSHIVPAGWSNWSGTSRDKTAHFAEFENSGPGADTLKRVSWSHQLTREQAGEFTLAKILSPAMQLGSPPDQWTKGIN